MNELDRLREIARKRRSAVTGKIARIRRNTGVDITGKPDDPRRDISVIKRYNKAQLNKYIGELNAFQSRSVGFVAGAGGVPIPKDKWRLYKRLETQYNSIGLKHFDKVADIFIDQSGMTIRERRATIHPTAMGEVVNSPYSQVDRTPSQIPSKKALDKIIKDMARKTTKKYLPGEIKKSRKQLNDMLKTIGSGRLATEARKLSDSQFDILWNYTNFATLVSIKYDLEKMRATDAKERWHDSVVENAESDIRELFDWASGVGEANESIEGITR